MRSSDKGFSLIELLIVIAVIAIVLAIALPSARVWLTNIGIRNSAQSIKDGLLVAKNEALKRNTQVEFVLTSAQGAGWKVQLIGGTEIQVKAAKEGSNALVESFPQNSVKVTFNSIGRIRSNADGSATPSQFNVDDASIAASKSRDLRVMVRNPAGDVRLCDPNVSAADDPSKCY